jgi:lipopolysaccharide export system permease protein
LSQNIIPKSNKEFINGLIRLTSKGVIADIKGGHFFVDIPGVTLFAEKVENGGKKLKDVFIHLRSEQGNEEKVILAEEGALIKQAQNKWGMGALRMHLTRGNITKTGVSSDSIEKIIFDEYDFPIVSNDFQAGLVTKDSMRSNAELWNIMNLPKSERVKVVDDAGYVKTRLEFWSRMNIPLQCIAFILLGFSLGIKQGRGRGKNSGALGLFTLIGYYAILFTGISLSRKGFLPPMASVFIPTLAAFYLAGRWYRKLDWVS